MSEAENGCPDHGCGPVAPERRTGRDIAERHGLGEIRGDDGGMAAAESRMSRDRLRGPGAEATALADLGFQGSGFRSVLAGIISIRQTDCGERQIGPWDARR
jgi:hypothetical protein